MINTSLIFTQLQHCVWQIWLLFMLVSAGGIVLMYLAFCATCNLRWTVYLRPIFHNDKKMYYIAPERIFFWKKLSWQWLILFVFSVKFVCLFWVYWGRKTEYFWSHKNLNQKSSGQGFCSSPAPVMISYCLFHLDCFSFKLFLLCTLQKARNWCFRILLSVLLFNTHW